MSGDSVNPYGKLGSELGFQGQPDGYAEESNLGDLKHPPDFVRDFHQYSDSDSATYAQHHTLGLSREQAARGDHTHDGVNSKPIPASALPSFASSYGFHGAVATVDLGGGFIGARFPISPGFTPSGGVITPFDGGSVSGTFNYNIESITSTLFTVSIVNSDGSQVPAGTNTECYGIVWK